MKYRRLPTGFSLLEIILALAVAGVVIVMAVRFYKTATLNQNINIIYNQISTITTNLDRLQVNSGSYSSANNSTILALGGGSTAMTTPYNSQFSFLTTPGVSSYAIQVGCLPPGLCSALIARLHGNAKFTGMTCTPGSSNSCGSTLTYSYINTN